MGTALIAFQPRHALDIINRNKVDFGRDLPDAIIDTMLKAYQLPGSEAYTLIADDVPVACGGIMSMGNGKGEAWVLYSSLAYKVKRYIYKILKEWFPVVAKRRGFRRVQAVCLRFDLDRWFQGLGFQKEADRLRCYGPNDEDVVLYSRIFKGET